MTKKSKLSNREGGATMLDWRRVRHFRILSEAHASTWDEKVARSGMTESAFLRLAVVENQTVVAGAKRPIPKKSIHPAAQEILHLLAKQGNNVNQIARNLNSDRKAGVINEATYKSALYELAALNEKSRLILSTI